jgi:D-arabinose 1-dehydrogenase-like Zn-dependent alcohol dehydrogenase
MLSFAAKHGIRPMIEKFPMTQAGVTQAMARLKDGKVRYRAVLEA